MSTVQAIFCQLLHVALVAAAAPLLAGAMEALAARLAGRDGPSLAQPWHDMRRLLRKQPLLHEDATPIGQFAPMVAFAVTAAAAILVPSFTTGMVLDGMDDLLVVTALLWLGRAAMVLAALDAGTAQGGLFTMAASRLNLLAEPARLLAVLAMAVLAGGTNVDGIADLQREGALMPEAAAALAAGALLLLGAADTSAGGSAAEALYGGRDLALCRATGWLRQLVWIDLIGALFCPILLAAPQSGLLDLGAGLIAWIARVAAFGLALALLRMGGGSRRSGAAETLGVALLLGMLALMLVLSNAGPT